MRVGSSVLIVAVFLVFSTAASAQQRAILWLVETAEDATVEADVARTLFLELLEGADDAEHIVDVDGLAEHMQRHGLPIPGCLSGMEACPNALAAVAEELRLDVIATARVFGDGERIELTVRGVNGGPARTLQFEGSTLRHTAFQVVTEFVGASAQLAVTSRPSAANVILDGAVVGQTPYQAQVAVGIYELVIDLEGYQPFEQTVELRPNESRLIDRDLDRMYAELVVQTMTPDATMQIDGASIGPPNASVHLMPGTHAIELAAPGYITETRQVTLDAGEDRRLRFDLRESPEAIRAREMGYIYDRPFFLRGGFRFAGNRSGFGTATGTIDGLGYETVCPRTSTGDCSEPGIAVNLAGIEGQLGLSFKVLEISLIGLSYSAAQIGGAAGDGRTLTMWPDDPIAAGRDEMSGRVSSMSRFQLEPLHVGARVLFSAHWSVFAHAGVGWYHESFEVRDLWNAAGDFSRNGWIWSADVGLRYHLNDTVFISGSFFLGDDFTYDDVDLSKGFDISVGITWEDVIGITDWFGGPSGPDDDEATPPEELDRGGW